MTPRTFVGHQRGLALATSEDINLAIDTYRHDYDKHDYRKLRKQRPIGREHESGETHQDGASD
jgi:hypothetical protein